MTRKERLNFTKLKKCPFCGNEEFYTSRTVTGTSQYNERFDGKEANDNSMMYESLMFWGGDKAYCNNCLEYLGNRTTNTLSRKAEKALAERSNKC